MASSGRLTPGETGKITASVDVQGKLGKIGKAIKVHTNDPEKPVSVLTVRMTIKDRLHMQKYRAEEIFSRKCRSCHIEKGRGKKGMELFNADCAMCHNPGKTASSIHAMRLLPEKNLLSAINDGVKNTSMPGFSKKRGGPLTKEEIRSLIRAINPE